jgi:hypothetical protein
MKLCRGESPKKIDDSLVYFESHVSPVSQNTFERCFSIDSDDGEQFTFGEICLSDSPMFFGGNVTFTPENVADIEIETLEQIINRMKYLQKEKDKRITK